MLSAFSQLYKKLNTQQKKAVDSIEGPVMVVAGPGTGKTAILTLRIANILKETDTEPANILALTFTESAAANMRRRLAEIIGSSAYSVVISTFHSFCNDIIKNYPDEFPEIIGSQAITEVDQVKILKEIITRNSLKELKPFGDNFYYLRPILSSLNELKREGVDPKKFNQIIDQEFKEFELIDDLYHAKGQYKGKMKGDYQTQLKQLKKNQELVKIYSEYQNVLAEKRLYDYSDMILEVMNRLEQSDSLLLIIQERSQYVLIDEHQDTNNAQNKIIELLCNFHENPNLFVVGDEKQAIFRFQGASLENFNYFKKLYPTASLIQLEENYRSTQLILDSAHSLLSGSTPLKSNFDHKPSTVSLFAFSKPEVETYFLAQDIAQRIKDATQPHEIAVLYRDNRDAFPIASSLEKMGIPFVIESDQNILDDLDIKKLILLLDTINNFGRDEKILQAMHIDFLEINPLDVYKIINYSNREKLSAFDILNSNHLLKLVNLEEPEKLKEFYRLLKSWKQFSENNSLPELFEKVVRESGFLTHILKGSDSVEKLDKLNLLFDEIRSLIETYKNYGLSDFFEYLDILREQNVYIKHKQSGQAGGRVRLMTAHKSKGQEFEHVYIVNAYDGHWGNKRKPKLLTLPSRIYALLEKNIETSDANDDSSPHSNSHTDNRNLRESNECGDERRLFYVAITRAKKSVTITYAKSNNDGRELLPSQFVSELAPSPSTQGLGKPKLLKTGDSAIYEKQFVANKSILFAPSKKVHVDIKNKDFIKEVFTNRGLSVTALNNYLECPWKYFYQNLLRIPKPPEKHQMYGIAIHAALKDFFNKQGADDSSRSSPSTQGLDKDYLLNQFNYYIERQPMNELDLSDWSERGRTALSGYYDQYHSSWHQQVLNEFNVGGILLTPEIRLTGQIDKIELLDSNRVHPVKSSEAESPVGLFHRVNVVDYKTGKPKSRNVITGETKSSDGNIKRQLVFYNLLLNLYAAPTPKSRSLDASISNGKYQMVSGDIDFVEPDDRGKYHKERLEVTKPEIADLEQLIKKTADEILNLKFWDQKCDNRTCEFCALRNMMA